MAISNKLRVTFDYTIINKEYEFYMITTSDNYINGGAYILDKPLDTLKAESVVFDNGRSLFLMFKKGYVSRRDIVSQLEDEKLSIKQVYSDEIKDYILFRLFLYSLNNFEFDENKFNNLSGKFYITNPSWLARNKKYFKALNINVDQNLCLSCEACTFSNISLFANNKVLLSYPKYEFSCKNNSLRRVLNDKNENVFVKKGIFGRKSEIVYFDFSKKKLKSNKAFYIYFVLDLLKKKFQNLLSFSFENLQVVKTIGKSRDEKISEFVREFVSFKNINLINWSNSSEFDGEFNELTALFGNERLGGVTNLNKIVHNAYNLVYLHNRDYYLDKKYKDPYKNFVQNEVIQHITVEDSVSKIINNNEAIYNTILKELLIKDDIVNTKKISLDRWDLFGFKGDYIFGKEKDGVHYFIIVKPDGSFSLINKNNNLIAFDNQVLKKCSDYLTSNKGKEKTIIADPNGNIIVVSRTQMFTLPSEEFFNGKKIGRSKDERAQYFSGVVDINLYSYSEKNYYSVGIKGSGMNTSIPKAPHLYQIDLIEGHDFISELLETMAVSFVKYKSFTVLPYPIKYLNEYILMCEIIRELND